MVPNRQRVYATHPYHHNDNGYPANGHTIPYPPPPPNNTQANTPIPLPLPIPIPIPIPSKSKVNGFNSHDAHYRLPDGWLVPIHPAWTRGDFVLVTEHNTIRQGYRVHAALLASASPWFGVQRDHALIHEAPDIVELFLAFLHLGCANVDASTLRPSLEQYHALHTMFVRFAITRSLCLVLRHHANSYAGDIVQTLGRTATSEIVWSLLDLARLLRSEGLWDAVLDTDYTTHGWNILHDPWEARVELPNTEAHAVLLLLHRLSAVDDAPLHEFRVDDRPYVYHQDTEVLKFPAI
ncbi:uncharacterized protein CcaverHIS019_0410810 [Cutaneotrichosporon cavernicola]|uniref:BTB domain-containing protein n=1 Tax=Cutaneotrichosporon cavernicola TaxID=279322 RepID=A0AA48L5C9_9TREE|nr:uncharacterized protein CcaverHIS019_0410810 [Cutaneotrichosporon cavernicola]BEI92261.1 hypothetical protein CcaverHIS019_0410810 [Cutaneotrichosporon cavernicola]BEJ00033.1 hypothetical protein CcaverHIS631_0410750 [Cutaneotrichosporon cavernicola]BEJ07805.1 hypothetical protein CcaverHIS641_0410740 [Cutaneotrichosporon cavernicola]